GILGTLIPNYIVIYGTRRGDPATISIIITSSIVASTIIGVVAFGDDFGFRDVIGIILVMLAITLLDPPKSIKDRVGEDDPLDEDLL
ncbi:MAG: EamA family transporter, partial [Candidatus Methanomethylophilaceae archaeon]|nr:EamA family transporter [Candidatus Methanomethylophilaceae archaeon]